MSELTPDILLRTYAAGIFPMAESADDPTLFWVDPANQLTAVFRVHYRWLAGKPALARILEQGFRGFVPPPLAS